MRLWSSMVLGGALVLACGGSDEAIFSQKSDSSAGTGASGGSAGNGGSAGTDGASGSSGSSGSAGSAGSGGDVTDAPADGGSTSTDASSDSQTDGGDAAAGSGGAADGGNTDSGVGIGGPGKVVCGDTACDRPNSQCCVGFPIVGCQPVFPPVCLTSIQLNCDDALDCENGRTCCATVVGDTITGANCATSCNNGVVICNDSTRCPGNTVCKPFAGLEHYRTCAPP